MKKSIFKNIVIFVLTIIMLSIYVTPVLADATLDPDHWKPESSTEVGALEGKAGTILGVIQVAGTVISVIALILIGVKYVMGSVEEKAEYKKTLLPYIIGAVMLFAASRLVQLIYEWANALNN